MPSIQQILKDLTEDVPKIPDANGRKHSASEILRRDLLDVSKDVEFSCRHDTLTGDQLALRCLVETLRKTLGNAADVLVKQGPARTGEETFVQPYLVCAALDAIENKADDHRILTILQTGAKSEYSRTSQNMPRSVAGTATGALRASQTDVSTQGRDVSGRTVVSQYKTAMPLHYDYTEAEKLANYDIVEIPVPRQSADAINFHQYTNKLRAIIYY